MPKTVTIYDDAELGLNPGWDEGLDPNISEMRRHAKITERENRELKERLTTLERKDTFAAVGIPRDVRGEAFAKVYEGDPADAEAVRSAYEALWGEIPPAGSVDDPAAADRKIADAAANGGATTPGSPGSRDFAEAIRAAKTPAEVKALIACAPAGARSPNGYGMRLPSDA